MLSTQNGDNTDGDGSHRVRRRRTELFLCSIKESGRFNLIEEIIVPVVMPAVQCAVPTGNKVMEIGNQRMQSLSLALLILRVLVTAGTVMVILYDYLRRLEKVGFIPYPTFMMPVLFLFLTMVHVYLSIRFFQSNMRWTIMAYMMILAVCLFSRLRVDEDSPQTIICRCYQAEPIEIDENGERI